MKYKLLILIALLYPALAIYSQETLNEETKVNSVRYLKTYGKIDLGLSGLGVSLETPLSDKVLLELAGGVGAGYKVDEDFKYRPYFDDPAIFASTHLKYYYNQQRRVDRGRPVSYNAGNFFALKAKYTSPTLCHQATWHMMLVAIHWGLQRKMGKYFVFQTTIGLGGAIDLERRTTTNVTLYPDVNFRVSYVLPFIK